MSDTQLGKAHALIEQGRIAEARRLLETLDDPTARMWLAQLNARKRPAKRHIPVPLPLLVAIGVVISVGTIIAILLLTPTLLSHLQNQFTEAQAATAAAEHSLNPILNQFCTQTADIAAAACLAWSNTVTQRYTGAALRCLGANGFETAERRTKFGRCLADAGVPLPA